MRSSVTPPSSESDDLARRRRSSPATSSSWPGLWASTIASARSATSRVGLDGLAAELRGERLRARGVDVGADDGSPQPRASALAMLPQPMNPIRIGRRR